MTGDVQQPPDCGDTKVGTGFLRQLPVPALLLGERSRANEALRTLLGIPQRKRVQWLKHVHPDDAARVGAACEAGFATGSPFTVDVRLCVGECWRTMRAECTPMPGGEWLLQFFERPLERPRSVDPRYRKIVDGIEDSICVVDSDLRINLFNPAMVHLLGIVDGSLQNRPIMDFVAPTDRAKLEARLLKDLQPDTPLDLRVLRPDGSLVWTQCTWMREGPCEFSSGCSMIVFTDISARKEIEEQVRSQSRFVSQVLNNLPMGVMVQQAGETGTITLWNHGMERLLGVSARDAIGRNLADVVDPTLTVGLLDAVRDCADTLATRSYDELSMAGSTGEAFIAEITVAPIHTGKGRARSLLIILNDVTERFRAEAEQRRLARELATREESYRTLAENVTDLITRHDASGKIIFASHAAQRLLGLDGERLVGCSPASFIHTGDHRLFERFLTRLLETGNASMLTYRIVRPDGQTMWVETSGEVRAVHGVTEFTCVTRDISERKRAEDELLQVQRQLSDAVESMESALAMYDADDRLVLCNSRYRHMIPAAAQVIRPGVTHAEVVEAIVTHNTFPDDWGSTAEEVRAVRRQEHRNPSGRSRIQRVGPAQWVQITDYPTSEGGVVSLLTDVTQLKLVQEELDRQRLLLTSLLDSIPDLIFYKDSEGTYISCNPAFCEFVGRKRDAIEGKTDYDIFPVDVADYFRDNDRKMAGLSASRRNEEWVAYPDGRLVLLDTLKTPMIVEGQVRGLVGISRDITERHQAESLLRAESSRLATLIQSMEGGVLVEDENRRIRLVNKVFMRLFDIPGNPEDIIGTDCKLALSMAATLFARPGEVATVIEALVTSNKPARSVILETVGHRYLECDFSPIAIGGHAYNYLWHYRDITSRRRAEIELQKRDVLLRGVAETVGQLLAGLDDFDNSVVEAFRIVADTAQLDGVRVFEIDLQHRTASQRYMWSRFDSVTHDDPRLRDMPLEPSFRRWMREFMQGRIVAGNLSALQPQERAVLEGLDVGALLLVPLIFGGTLWGVIAFGTRRERDWTETDRNILRMVGDSVGYAIQRKHSRDELNRALAEAERLAIEADKASKATTDFLASMSHEIRTPLNGLTGYANLLRKSCLDERQRYLLDRLDTSSEILLALINDILDLSKVNAGQLSLDTTPMLPGQAVADVIETLRPRAAEKGLTVKLVDAGLPPHTFMGDERRLKQVLLNLLGNAIKFTQKGGITIDICARPEEGSPDLWRIGFAVTDTGIGIATENQSRLFAPFSQARDDIGRRFGGTGLGLAICLKLVTLMGGSIHVESQEGHGATFRFHILCPLAPTAPQRAVEVEGASESQVGAEIPLSILIADDNLINQEVLTLYLEDMGYNPIVADDGAEAFAIVQQQHVDLIFMDLRMPNMDGRESTLAIRKWEQEHLPANRQPIVILALTADALKSDLQRCEEVGMNDYVTKPIEPEKIELLIRRHFSTQTGNRG